MIGNTNATIIIGGGGNPYILGQLYSGLKQTLDEEDFMYGDNDPVMEILGGMYNELSSVEQVTIPEGVEIIDGSLIGPSVSPRTMGCFSGLGAMIRECVVSFPSTLTYINEAFNGYDDFNDYFVAPQTLFIELPDACESVANSFIYNGVVEFKTGSDIQVIYNSCNFCDMLTTVEIGENITDITESFTNCQALETITIHALTPPRLIGYIDDTSLQAIYVPSSAVTDYQQDANWAYYAAYIQADPNS